MPRLQVGVGDAHEGLALAQDTRKRVVSGAGQNQKRHWLVTLRARVPLVRRQQSMPNSFVKTRGKRQGQHGTYSKQKKRQTNRPKTTLATLASLVLGKTTKMQHTNSKKIRQVARGNHSNVRKTNTQAKQQEEKTAFGHPRRAGSVLSIITQKKHMRRTVNSIGNSEACHAMGTVHLSLLGGKQYLVQYRPANKEVMLNFGLTLIKSKKGITLSGERYTKILYNSQC